MTEQITIIKPDDLHLHLRDGEILSCVLPHTANQFARAIVMPNLPDPVTTVDKALSYRDRIISALPAESDFNPLMTLYLTDQTSPDEIRMLSESPDVHAVKYYPAGATTNSANGVTDITNVYSVLEQMEKSDVPLLLHGEDTDHAIDVFDREKSFIEKTLAPLIKKFPALRIVLEHITTTDAVQFIECATDNVAATITAHHLMLNRNDLFRGGIRPHHYCLPVLKAESHRLSLVDAATSGSKKFFLGTDSAPHLAVDKESACGCAGIYTAFSAIEFYTDVFEQKQSLDKLENFSSKYGADFYKLPQNSETITLRKDSWSIPEKIDCYDSAIIPLHAGKDCQWKLVRE